jgi:hypothetical protein
MMLETARSDILPVPAVIILKTLGQIYFHLSGNSIFC